MAANTDVKICNLAIDMVRGERIVNLQTGTSEEAKVCRIHYDHLKVKFLSRWEWVFNSRYLQIAKSAITPIPTGWTYQYPVPGDFLTLREIVDSSSPYSRGYHATDGQVIYFNDPTLIIRYSALVTEAEFHPMFTDALAAELAVHLSLGLKDAAMKARDAAAIAEDRLIDAIEVAATEVEEVVPALWTGSEESTEQLRRV